MSGFEYANRISNFEFHSPSPPASPPSSSSDEDDASPSPTDAKPYCWGCDLEAGDGCDNQAAHWGGCQRDPRYEDLYSSDEGTSIDYQRLSNTPSEKPSCLACKQELTTDAQCLDAHTCNKRPRSLSPRPVKRSRSETQPLTSPEASPSKSPDPPYYNTSAVWNEVNSDRGRYSRDTTVGIGDPCDNCGAKITDNNSSRCGPGDDCLIQTSQKRNY